jgi:hypothetical protein
VLRVPNLDRRLDRLTAHRIDLKLALPLALGGLGVWRAAVARLGCAEIPAAQLAAKPLLNR